MYVTWENKEIAVLKKKKKKFECIIHYGDHLLITENPEELVGVMEV